MSQDLLRSRGSVFAYPRWIDTMDDTQRETSTDVPVATGLSNAKTTDLELDTLGVVFSTDIAVENAASETSTAGTGINMLSRAPLPYEEPLINATAPRDDDERRYRLLAEILQEAQNDSFEDGIESALFETLTALIERHGNAIVVELAHLMRSGIVEEHVAEEALRCIGDIEHPASHYFRLKLLEGSLTHPSVSVRDGAVIGLEALNYPDAVVALRNAVHNEPYEELRSSMEYVITQLENAD